MKLSTRRWLSAAAGNAVTFTALDAVWITAVARHIYAAEMPHLLARSMSVGPALVFYGGYILGTVHLAVRPQEHDRTWRDRARDGALVGALAYGAWGLTGAAVLDRFPVSVAASDIAWGAALTAVSSSVAGAVMDRLSARD